MKHVYFALKDMHMIFTCIFPILNYNWTIQKCINNKSKIEIIKLELKEN